MSGSYDGTVCVCDMQGKELAVCRGHEDWVYSVCVINDNKVVSASADQTIRVWDMKGMNLRYAEAMKIGFTQFV